MTNRHQLDKTDIKSMVSGQLCQSKAFSIIDTSLENDIDLGWNLLLFHGMKPVQYLWKLVISGDLSIDIRVKSIQADIDSVKSLAAEGFLLLTDQNIPDSWRCVLRRWLLLRFLPFYLCLP